jgi:hypothetical protein
MLKKLLIASTLATSLVATSSSALTLFYEDFESDLSQWGSANGIFSGVIVDDPLNPGSNKAVTFTQLWGGGDITTPWIHNPTGQYTLSFDYLGTCGHSDCGGFIWNDITGWNGTNGQYPDTLPDTGKWEHLSFTFSGAHMTRIFLEDWNGSGGFAGDAFFDNIELTDANGSTRAVSEPASIALLGLGLLGLGFIRRQKS